MIRRRCFALLLIVLAVLVVLGEMGIPLRMHELSGIDASAGQYTGKIIRIQEKESKYTFRVRLMTENGHACSYSEDVLLSYYKDDTWGDFSDVDVNDLKSVVKIENYNLPDLLNARIAFTASLSDANRARNPHCFDYYMYIKSCGIGKIATIDSFSVLDSTLTPKEKYDRFLFAKRQEFLAKTSEDVKGIIAGVLFGDTSYLEEDVYEDFRNNGTAHILAVSGLHIGILYGLYKKIVGKRRNLAALMLLATMLFTYGTLSMWSTSSIRGILMIMISTIGRYTDRRYDMLTALAIAAFVLIIHNPYVIYGCAFQMSFLAIASIAFLQPLISLKVPESLRTAIAVNFGLLIYQADVFNYISLVSLIANIPIIFLTGYFVPIAIASFFASVAGAYVLPLRAVTEGIAKLLTSINEFSSLGGFSSIDVVSPPKGLTIFFICMTFFLASETFYVLAHRKKTKQIIAGVLAICIVCGIGETFSYSPITHDDIVFVDVGQGDCLHIRAGGRDVLIDGGGKIDYNLGKKTLKPYLLKNGVSSLDVAIATHLHTDHYKGLTELAECMKVGEIYTRLTAGQTLNLEDDVSIKTLWPVSTAGDDNQDENKNCSVFMIYYEGYKILVTGDLDSEGEAAMMNYYRSQGQADELDCDVLKVGHHGSKYSTSAEFLACAGPQIAVIQVGKNTYGHPSAETVERLEAVGVRVYRNDECGAIGLRFSKKGIAVHKNLS